MIALSLTYYLTFSLCFAFLFSFRSVPPIPITCSFVLCLLLASSFLLPHWFAPTGTQGSPLLAHQLKSSPSPLSLYYSIAASPSNLPRLPAFGSRHAYMVLRALLLRFARLITSSLPPMAPPKSINSFTSFLPAVSSRPSAHSCVLNFLHHPSCTRAVAF